MSFSRRSLLQILAAPAIVRVASIMPVRALDPALLVPLAPTADEMLELRLVECRAMLQRALDLFCEQQGIPSHA